jgi:hypothetical protein
MNPEMMENAPDGFTSRIMSSILLEPVPVKAQNKFENLRIPIFSAIVTIGLIVLALFTGEKNETLQIPVPELVKDIKFTLPDINSIFSINLPSSLIYVLAALVILTFFDKVLKMVFRSEN